MYVNEPETTQSHYNNYYVLIAVYVASHAKQYNRITSDLTVTSGTVLVTYIMSAQCLFTAIVAPSRLCSSQWVLLGSLFLSLFSIIEIHSEHTFRTNNKSTSKISFYRYKTKSSLVNWIHCRFHISSFNSINLFTRIRQYNLCVVCLTDNVQTPLQTVCLKNECYVLTYSVMLYTCGLY